MRSKDLHVAIVLALMCSCGSGQLTFTHHNWTEVEIYLKDVQTRYSNIARLYSIGRSVEERDLWVMSLGESQRDYLQSPPEVGLVGSTQGNAVVGCECLLHLTEYLVTQYGQNETVTSLLRTTRIHLLITANPDGYALAHTMQDTDRCGDDFGRSNANNVPINGNFPDAFMPHVEVRQLETKAIMAWLQRGNFILAAYFYGAALLVAYPYSNGPGEASSVYSRSVDDDLYRHLAATYARAHPTMHDGENCPDIEFHTVFPGGIVNGAFWYKLQGTFSDYASRFHSAATMAIGISCCKFPPASELPKVWAANKDALIKYIQTANIGVTGLVLTAEGQEINNAWVSVSGREVHKTKTTPFGRFRRLLLAGRYTLKVTAPGFIPQRVSVTVHENKVTELNVYLRRLSTGEGRVGPPPCVDDIILLDCPPDENEATRALLRKVSNRRTPESSK